MLQEANSIQSIQKANDALADMIAPEEQERECDLIIEYQDKAVTAMAILDNVLTRYVKYIYMIDPPRSSMQNPSQVLTPATPSVMSEIKLKPLELKKFSGKFEEWLPFWEKFKIAVHENDSLSISVKFNYLSNALEGKAATTIQGYLPTVECYEEVISALQNEYGNNEKLIEKYIQKLVNIKAVTVISDVKGLRALYNEISATMRTLSALKIEASQYRLMIKSILLTSIPTKSRRDFYKIADQDSENTGNIKILLEFIKNEVRKGELIRKMNIEQKKSDRIGTATSLITNCQSHAQGQSMFCVFCKNNNHNTKACRGKLTSTQRKEILKKEGRCYRCSNKNHTSKFCKAQWVKCEECSVRHITSLCEKHNQKSMQSENVRESEKAISLQKPDATLNTLESDQSEIFLQTAKAVVINSNENKQILTRIIMDNGSQRTFITQSLKNELNLKKCGNQLIRIMSFGVKSI